MADTFLPGLVSITFRRLDATEVIGLVSQAGLAGIEWGGDLHVPHGQVGVAREVGHRTRDAGLVSAAYGSYYRAGGTGQDSFASIVDTAVALGTKIVRIWAGNQASAKSDDAFVNQVIEDGRKCAELAATAGLTIACEWHADTLTDTAESATRILNAVDHPNFKTYWQPRNQVPASTSLADMDAALPRLVGVHVFEWHETTRDRLPLADGEDHWRAYFAKLNARPGGVAGQFALLEFVKNDDPQQFLADAEVLKRLLE
jgi:3-dehydroshikimate dehydratase